MSERSRSRPRKRHRRSYWQKCIPSVKAVSWVAVAAAVVSGSIAAFRSSGSGSEETLPLPRIQRDLAAQNTDDQSPPENAETDATAEPGRLEFAATTQARAVQMTGHQRGPLFDESLDVNLAAPGQDSIEVARFRPTATGRVQANQAAWLTGSIEPVE